MTEEHSAFCPCCGSKNVYGISRVVGYYSRINNWNKSKVAELRDRQKGNYAIGETKKQEEHKEVKTKNE